VTSKGLVADIAQHCTIVGWWGVEEAEAGSVGEAVYDYRCEKQTVAKWQSQYLAAQQRFLTEYKPGLDKGVEYMRGCTEYYDSGSRSGRGKKWTDAKHLAEYEGAICAAVTQNFRTADVFTDEPPNDRGGRDLRKEMKPANACAFASPAQAEAERTFVTAHLAIAKAAFTAPQGWTLSDQTPPERPQARDNDSRRPIHCNDEMERPIGVGVSRLYRKLPAMEAPSEKPKPLSDADYQRQKADLAAQMKDAQAKKDMDAQGRIYQEQSRLDQRHLGVDVEGHDRDIAASNAARNAPRVNVKIQYNPDDDKRQTGTPISIAGATHGWTSTGRQRNSDGAFIPTKAVVLWFGEPIHIYGYGETKPKSLGRPDSVKSYRVEAAGDPDMVDQVLKQLRFDELKK
jgi:hypothetical protein